MSRREWIVGYHAALAVITEQPEDIINVWVQQGVKTPMMQEILHSLTAQSLNHQSTSKAVLQRLSKSDYHQGVVVEKRSHKDMTLDQLLLHIKQKPCLLLILDGIQDPHNLGACLRTADAAGVDAVIMTQNRTASMTTTVAKVASGAATTVKRIQVVNLARTISHLKAAGVWTIGLTNDASENIYQLSLNGSIAIVVGAEGSGLRALTKQKCDVLAKIPLHGYVHSLNVAVATGIALYEVLRQRQC